MSHTVIKSSCPVCGPVDLTPRDLTLNVSARSPEFNHYVFRCPHCQDRVERPATPEVIRLLADGGVIPKTPWEPPVDPETRRPGGLPLTEDDLITFGLKLHFIADIVKHAA
jgi:hypothetical protein